MYEIETVENPETLAETPAPDTGSPDLLPADISANTGLLLPAESPSVASSDEPSVSSGDGISAGVWYYSPVSGGDMPVYQYPLESSASVPASDYTETLAEISDRLSGIEKALTLVFIFLLLSWTASRIPVAVRRFTRERR